MQHNVALQRTARCSKKERSEETMMQSVAPATGAALLFLHA
jgi:hypothetical protein